MPISATTVWEVRTAGNDTNGGGYSSGGTDWSQQDSPQYSVTDGVTNGSTTITSATAAFGTDVVGNVMYVQGGTGAVVAGWYQIISRTNATTIVVDRSTGLTSGTGVTLRIGGALASPGQCCAVAVSENSVWLRSGTYLITSTTSNIAGGRVLLPSGVRLLGYGTTRADYTGTRPVLQASGIATTTLATFTNPCNGGVFRFLTLDGNSLTSIRGAANAGGSANSCRVHDCRFVNCTNGGVDITVAGNSVSNCYAENCSGNPAFNAPSVSNCIATANTNAGFGHNLSASGQVYTNCISYNNTTANGIGFHSNNGQDSYINCTAFGNASDGFKDNGGSANGCYFQNCVSYGNSGFGYNMVTSTLGNLFLSCAAGSNTAGATPSSTRYILIPALIALTADPFVNTAGGNFALNNTAGGGAALRAVGMPGVFPAGLTTGYLDIGAAQHQDSGSGGGIMAGRNWTGGYNG